MVHLGRSEFRAGRAALREFVSGPRLEAAGPGLVPNVKHTEPVGRKALVESARGIELNWRGAAIVNDQIWRQPMMRPLAPSGCR